MSIIHAAVRDAATGVCEKQYDRVLCDVPCSGLGVIPVSYTHLGLEVARLKRTAIGAVKLGMLPQGRFRDLTPDEVRRLRAAAQKKGNAQNTQREEEKQNAANRTNGEKNRRSRPAGKNRGRTR